MNERQGTAHSCLMLFHSLTEIRTFSPQPLDNIPAEEHYTPFIESEILRRVKSTSTTLTITC